ncbi:MAG: hypothetical protein JF619_05040, partial [Massilia sp.]|nr:hypothetical protein [Massilia sp.]
MMRLLAPALAAALLAGVGQACAGTVEVLVQTPAGAALADAAVLVEPLPGAPRPHARAPA